MFTGIITETAAVRRHEPDGSGATVSFSRPTRFRDLLLGESIATNGACLTVAALRDDEYDCYLLRETLSKTTFGEKFPERVNLERSLGVGDRFGGHFVSGHVDGVGRVSAIAQKDDVRLSVEFDPNQVGLVMYKGSICINGVSLTVAEIIGSTLTVALIPHTLENTTLGDLRIGDGVNLEFDMIGKYIANVMETRAQHAENR